MDGREVEISVQENDPTYAYCSQDMYGHIPISFTPIASKQPSGKQWMTSDQERIAKILGLTALGIVICASLILVYRFLIAVSRFFTAYKVRMTIYCLLYFIRDDHEECIAFLSYAHISLILSFYYQIFLSCVLLKKCYQLRILYRIINIMIKIAQRRGKERTVY